MRKYLQLVYVSLALILCLVGTSVVTAANGRVLTATLSFSKPVYLGSLAEYILKYPGLAVAEVRYTYPGETPVVRGHLAAPGSFCS
jgi:hypothetical protein